MPYTYLVQCADNSYYAGWTTDLQARVKAHNSGRGARYTRSRRPVQLVYWEIQPTQSAAQQREAAIRRKSHTQKAAMVDAFEASRGSFEQDFSK